ncbi:alpha-1,4-N-acetylglucosaminyltransferase EXTL3 [Paragonimus westermani]|uniref:Alpha-1,4-N-acetylglucosaminyltransferase EXTL3 n=1 Tax=Paragonimus westermani TaxID=34504 RepID=A0A5J4NXF9_9TREM|nr:alpha-1,4-N-acetylglucosaminyltransferase EXTL3 [Paragonimus westermani]
MHLDVPKIRDLSDAGQILFQRYLKDRSSQVASLLLSVSQRMHLKQPPAKTVASRVVYESFRETNELPPTRPTCSFTRLDSAGLVDPFWSYCTTPWDPPHSSMYMHSSPVDAEGGLSIDSHTINILPTIPVEKFTVIILTYNRYNSLCQTLKSLIKLPYLHSVLVVWNNPNWSPDGLRWPRLHVPLRLALLSSTRFDYSFLEKLVENNTISSCISYYQVIRATKNSLNNRFLPYDLIDTDAVFTLDDDLTLPQETILMAFR